MEYKDKKKPGGQVNVLTREAIQEAFLYLLGRKSYDEISVTDICQKAGVSRSAYYRNYNNKDEVIEDFSKSILHLVFASLKNPEYALNRREWFHFVFDQIYASRRLFKLVIQAKNVSVINSFMMENWNTYTKEEKYQIIAIRDGLTSIIMRWISKDFDISIDKLTEICCMTFTDISLLFRNKANYLN